MALAERQSGLYWPGLPASGDVDCRVAGDTSNQPLNSSYGDPGKLQDQRGRRAPDICGKVVASESAVTAVNARRRAPAWQSQRNSQLAWNASGGQM